MYQTWRCESGKTDKALVGTQNQRRKDFGEEIGKVNRPEPENPLMVYLNHEF
jgi:hypothetical protein